MPFENMLLVISLLISNTTQSQNIMIKLVMIFFNYVFIEGYSLLNMSLMKLLMSLPDFELKFMFPLALTVLHQILLAK